MTLLGGGWGLASATTTRRRRGALYLAIGASIIGAALVVSPLAGLMEAQWGFLGGGAVLLVAALAWISWAIRPHRVARTGLAGAWPVLRLGIRNAGRQTGRSLLTMGLLASATFLLVTVAAFRQSENPNDTAPTGPAGGYQLIVQSSIALPAELSSPEGRWLMGFREPDAAMWSQGRYLSLPVHRAQNISCLNLARPTEPTILSAPDPQTWAGRFEFARTIRRADNPWTLLAGQSDGQIPAVTDDETARYILHLDIGQSLTVTDDQGRPRRLAAGRHVGGGVLPGRAAGWPGEFPRALPHAERVRHGAH